MHTLEETSKKSTFSDHAKSKCKRKVNLYELRAAVYNDKEFINNIIEYNQTKHSQELSHRILIRHPETVRIGNHECYQYMVLAISDKKSRIVTVYYNKTDDTHKTLDMSYYDDTLRVPKHINF